MDLTVLFIFILVYVGMILGEIPGLALDRTGIALLGAIALLVFEKVSPEAAWIAIDVPTMALLFGLMVISAQFRLGGFYTWSTRKLAAAHVPPEALLGLLILLSGVLSALLANDIVCLAITPVLIEGCAKRKLPPLPFLLALACSANIGSPSTLIGNPQNMLIGQKLKLSFGGYLLDAGVPAVLGCLATWLIIRRLVAGQWHQEAEELPVELPPFNPWQSLKGSAVVMVLMVAFLLSPWPREMLAMACAGWLLLSRSMHSRDMLGLVDWQLLALFAGLFVVNHAVAVEGLFRYSVEYLAAAGVDISAPAWLFAASVLLSNLVSNVPAVILLLPAATHPQAGAVLALSSTLAGNLFLVGSIANLIVVDQAARLGIRITWREHARVGVPVTAATLAIAALWLWLRAMMAG